MIFGEWDWDLYIKVQREEAFEDGETAGAQANARENARNLLKLGVDSNVIAQGCSLPLEEVLALKEELARETVAQ